MLSADMRETLIPKEKATDSQDIAIFVPQAKKKIVDDVNSAKKVFTEILSGTSSFGLRSLLVAAQFAANAYIMTLLGPKAAAASGITTAGVALGVGTMTGFGAATGVELGKALAMKDHEAVGAIIKIGWISSILLGGVTAGAFLSTRGFLPLFLDEGVATAASDLFTTLAAAVPAELLIWNNGQVPFKIENNPWIPLLTTVAYRGPAAALAYYFAVELGMGPKGIGVGAAVAGWTNIALFQAWYSKKQYHQYDLYNPRIKNFNNYIKKFFKTGWPVALQRSSEWVNLFIISQIIGAWSSEKLLASQVSLALLVASGLMTQGSGQFSMIEVTQTRKSMLKHLADFKKTGNEKDLVMVEHLIDKNYKHFIISNVAGIAFNLLLTGIVYLARNELIETYAPDGTDNTTVALALTFLWVNSISLPFDASRNITAGILRGWDDLLFPTLLSLLLMTFIGVPLGFGVGKVTEENALALFVARTIALVLTAAVEVKRFLSHHSEDLKLYESEVLLKDILGELTAYSSASTIIDPAQVVVLRENAARAGFIMEDVPGDGNCFFHAVEGTLVDGRDHLQLRRLVAEHIRANITSYEDYINGNSAEFLERIAKRGEWADHLLIQALSRALNINIVLIRSDGTDPTIIKQREAERTIYLAYQIDHHYQILRGEPTEALKALVDIAEFENFGAIINPVAGLAHPVAPIAASTGSINQSSVRNSENDPALLLAVKNASTDAEAIAAVTPLLNSGARPISIDSAARSCGWTALHWAAYKGYAGCIRLILSSYTTKQIGERTRALNTQTAEPWLFFSSGRQTPIWLAAKHSRMEAYHVLQEFGADLTIKAVDGSAPALR